MESVQFKLRRAKALLLSRNNSQPPNTFDPNTLNQSWTNTAADGFNFDFSTGLAQLMPFIIIIILITVVAVIVQIVLRSRRKHVSDSVVQQVNINTRQSTQTLQASTAKLIFRHLYQDSVGRAELSTVITVESSWRPTPSTALLVVKRSKN